MSSGQSQPGMNSNSQKNQQLFNHFSQPNMRSYVQNNFQNTSAETEISNPPESSQGANPVPTPDRTDTQETSAQQEVNKRDFSQLYDDYKSMSEELTKSFKRMKEERIGLEEEATKLSQENDFIDSETKMKNALIAELRSEFERLNAKLFSSKSESIRKLELKIKELHSMLDSILSFDAYITNFKNECEESLKSTVQYCEEMRSKVHSMREKCLKSGQDYLDSIKEIVKEHTNLIKNIKNEDNLASAEFQNEVMNYKRILAERRKFESDMEELKRSIKTEEESIINLKATIETQISLRLSLEAKGAEYSSYQNQAIKEAEGKIADLKKEVIGIDNSLQKDETELKTLMNEYNHEKSQHEAVSREWNLKTSAYDTSLKECNSLESERENLKKEIEQLAKGLEESLGLNEEFSKTEKELSEAQKRRDNLKETLDSEKSLQTSLQTSLANKEIELDEANATQNALVNKNQVLSEEYTLFESKVDLLNKAKNEIENEVADKESLVMDLDNNDGIKKLRQQNEELAAKLKSVEEEIECYQRKIHIACDLVAFYDEIVKEVETEINVLEKDFTEVNDSHEEEESRLLSEYKELYVEYSKDKIDSMKGDINFVLRQKNKLLENHEAEIDEIKRLHGVKKDELSKMVEDQDSYFESVMVQLNSEKANAVNKTNLVKKKVVAKKEKLSTLLPSLITLTKNSLIVFNDLVDRYCHVWAEKTSGEPATVNIYNIHEDLEETLRLPLYKLSKLRGMPALDSSTSNPEVYKMILIRGNEIFNEIVNSKEKKPVEYTCRRLQEIVSCLYNSKRRNNSPVFNKLNDTHYSTTTVDE